MIEFIDKLAEIGKMLVMILPFVLLCLANEKDNLPAANRSRQFLMPPVATVIMIVVMFYTDEINRMLLNFIKYIPKFLMGLDAFSWIPEKVGAILTQIGSLLQNFLNSLNMNFWIFFISNWVIIGIYLVVKKAVISILSGLYSSENELYHSLYDTIAGEFYEYFPERDKWCIKNSYAQTRKFLRALYYASIGISVVLMLVSRYFYDEKLLRAIFYPVFGVVIVGELYFYLCGLTKREYTQDVLGEAEDAYKIVNYSLLRKFLRSLFKDKLLAESTNVNNALAGDMTTADIIYSLEKNEDPKVVAFATFMDALNKTGFDIDNNYLYSSLDLLNGKSILFNNPFYNDHIPYAFYPMNRVLLSHKKVLVILGRHSIEDDIKEWLEKGIESVTNIPFMWKIGVLSDQPQDIDIGIITRSDVLDIRLHEANADFLEEVEYCVIIEPSKLISTAQIGLNLIIKKCRSKEDRNIVFCMFDKNCDGLVDAMSHILMTSISEVSATQKHLGTSSYMTWEADDEYIHHRMVPNISRYLGVGTELSFAGLKNQVSKATWFGGEAFPVTDMNWIDRQYYYELMKYAGLPTSQEAMDERFKTTPNYWSAKVAKHNYFTVEDESFNMFEILREFATRSTEQGFVNVISSEYLLKDYMADNASIFEADPKAIPYIVADYARTDRNVILRLLLMMSTFPVTEETVVKELSLIGIKAFDLKKQIWHEIYKCYADTKAISSLSSDYRTAVEEAYVRPLDVEGAPKDGFTPDIILCKERYNMREGKMETVYSIVNPAFIASCASELKSAGYVAEDEKGEKYYLGSELSGHIYQKYLPGQFFTFGGKYYEMQYLTAEGQVLVRRAADHISGRPAYRQIRKYEISGARPLGKIGACQDIAGMKVIREYADIRVKTPGYYRMNTYNDFANAKKILFDEESGIPERIYKNKEILRIELPDMNGALTDDIRYTVTVLFNEIFKTLFADNQPFISAVTCADHLDEEDGNPLTYSIGGSGFEISRNSIYIIEDSQLDLGLAIAVERNLKRIFEIIQDYLAWHAKTLYESLNPPPEPQPPAPPAKPQEGEGDADADANGKKKKKGFFKRIIEAIKKPFKKIKEWFKKRKKKKGEPQDGETPETEGADVPETDPAETPEEAGESENFSVHASVEPKIRFSISYSGPNPPAEGSQDGENSDDWGNNDITSLVDDEPVQEPEAVDEEALEIAEEIPEIQDEPFDTVSEEPVEETAEPEEEATEIEYTEPVDEPEPVDDYTQPEPVSDGEEEPAQEGEIVVTGEAEQAVKHGGDPFERKKYHNRYYLLFGGDSESASVNIGGALDYLSAMGFDAGNPLKQARDGKNIAQQIEASYNPNSANSRFCDFCGCEILGVEYETLLDGRDRCMACGRTAIKTEEEFKALFEDVKRNMESFFGIKINAGVRVEMVNSQTLHKRIGRSFVPTGAPDGRVLGVAISDKNGYSLLIENGAPRISSMLTMAHELTHIWQYINWDEKALANRYGKKNLDEIYEGMAKWVEIQYAYLINEPAIAKREEIRTAYRDDEYGRGFLRFRAVYPFSTGTVITKPTPFLNTEDPLNPNVVRANISAPAEKKKKRIVIPKNKNEESKGGMRKGIIFIILFIIILAIFIKAFANGDPADPNGTGTTTGTSATTGVVQNNRAVNDNKYYYNQLSDEEKKAYDAICNAVYAFEENIDPFPASVDSDTVFDVYNMVLYDNPEINWMQSSGCTSYSNQVTGKVSSAEFHYVMDKAEAESRMAQVEAVANEFLATVDDSLSDYEVALMVYNYLAGHVDYDTVTLNKTESDDDYGVTEPDDLRSLYGFFIEKKVVCAGYAYAAKYLFNQLGIECAYVTGYSEGEAHAWNLVKLDGEYYYMDATWADESNTDPSLDNGDNIGYEYFAMTTEELLRSHSLDDADLMPRCTSTDCNYYINEGCYVESYSLDKVKEIVLNDYKEGKTRSEFQFASDAEYEKAVNELIDGNGFWDVAEYVGSQTGENYSGISYIQTEEARVLKLELT